MTTQANDIVEFARDVLGVTLYPGQAEALREYYASGRPNWLLLSGRRGGKSLLSDVVACYEALVPDFSAMLRPGEPRYILIVSVRQDNAALHIRTISKLLKRQRSISKLITAEAKDRIELANGVIILSLPASARAGRGFTASTLIFDELAHFLDSNGNASADQVYDAFEPTAATFGDAARIIITTTPASKTGIVFDLFDRALPDWYITRKTTRDLNPKVNARTIERARQRDAESAAVEYDAEFRDPVEAFLNGELLDAAVNHGLKRAERGVPGVSYSMAIDPATMADRYGFLIAHKDGERIVLDYARVLRPPVDPNAAEDLLRDLVAKFQPVTIRCDTASTVARLKGEIFQLEYTPFSRPLKLKIYGALKEALNLSRLVLYPDDDLLDELRALQIRNGVDISAPKSGRVTHDDLADCLSLVCEALVGNAGMVTTQPNPFYGATADQLAAGWTWARAGNGFVMIPSANRAAGHPLTAEAVARCRYRMSGCPRCTEYYEMSGEYAAQEADARAHAQEGQPLPDPDRDRRRNLPAQPIDHYRAFVTKFNLKG